MREVESEDGSLAGLDGGSQLTWEKAQGRENLRAMRVMRRVIPLLENTVKNFSMADLVVFFVLHNL